ncbi:hypothetical protein PN441_18990 [Spirulina major CS-329]|jgi:hypothetical protein|nr:hypothetical protein [Spirulina subsalsa]MDB9494102.1 hypothetical protein [Spirulina subsalsa CS-330]MDB9505171.1 hypothetical protein [Spirulina major CS-329]
MFGSRPPQTDSEPWKYRLDQFARDCRPQIAALSWSFHLANPETTDVLGIDLQPQPHFVTCPRRAVEALNQNVAHQLQEVLGLLDAYQPETEVLILAIGDGQIKILFFEPDPTPPEAYQTLDEPVLETLMVELEDELARRFAPESESTSADASAPPDSPGS